MGVKKNIAIATGVICATTLGIHIANKIITFKSTIDNNLDSSNGNYYTWRFGDIFYRKSGSGKPILLIHDLESYSSSHEWSNLISSLSETNTVYSLDLLGCGRSDKPNIEYTNFLFVQLINDFINEVIGEPVHVVASNSSTSVVIMSATFNSKSLSKVVLINPSDIKSFSKAPSKLDNAIKHLIRTPIFGTLSYNIMNRKSYIESIFVKDFYHNREKINSTDINTYHEAAHLCGCNGKYLFASIKGNYLNANIAHALSTLSTNIYIISSDSSSKYLTTAKKYQDLSNNIEVFLSKDSNKYPHMEDTDLFIAQLQSILN